MLTLTPSHDRLFFTRIASQRARQLMGGAMPRIRPDAGYSSAARIARAEVIHGLVAFGTPDSQSRDSGIRYAGVNSDLTPAPVQAQGGVSVVITESALLAPLEAAVRAGSMAGLRKLFTGPDMRVSWRIWHEPAFEPETTTEPSSIVLAPGVDEETSTDDLSLLRTALETVRAAWSSDVNSRDALVMTLTLRDGTAGELALEASEPVLFASPGSLSLKIAGKLVKPVSWVVTWSVRGGFSRSVSARSVRDRMRAHARKMRVVEVLDETSEVQPSAIATASGLVIFVHGLLSTDIGTFDGLLDRVRWLSPTALRVGFAHDTLASIKVNAQTLAKWLIAAVGFDHDNDRVERELPIVFACHSRGGLVARATAVLLRRHNALRGLLRGIITFGTPHQGAALSEAPEEMAAVIAIISAFSGSRSAMGVAEILAYIRNGGTFEGIRNLQPPEGAKDPSTNFLTWLQEEELTFGTTRQLQFGGTAPVSTRISRIVGHALKTTEHDHVVERSSTTPNAITGVATACNHFGYFLTISDNKPKLDQAARQIRDWLR